jgi:hypothetical protein
MALGPLCRECCAPHGAAPLAVGAPSCGPAARCSQKGGLSAAEGQAGWQLGRGEAAATSSSKEAVSQCSLQLGWSGRPGGHGQQQRGQPDGKRAWLPRPPGNSVAPPTPGPPCTARACLSLSLALPLSQLLRALLRMRVLLVRICGSAHAKPSQCGAGSPCGGSVVVAGVALSLMYVTTCFTHVVFHLVFHDEDTRPPP